MDKQKNSGDNKDVGIVVRRMIGGKDAAPASVRTPRAYTVQQDGTVSFKR